jgi:hypothetical protein
LDCLLDHLDKRKEVVPIVGRQHPPPHGS